MSDSSDTLTPSDTAADLQESSFTHSQGTLSADFDTGNFVRAVQLLNEVTTVAEELNHHPDVELGYGHVKFTLSSHDVGGVTSRDLALAKRINEAARAFGNG